MCGCGCCFNYLVSSQCILGCGARPRVESCAQRHRCLGLASSVVVLPFATSRWHPIAQEDVAAHFQANVLASNQVVNLPRQVPYDNFASVTEHAYGIPCLNVVVWFDRGSKFAQKLIGDDFKSNPKSTNAILLVRSFGMLRAPVLARCLGYCVALRWSSRI